MILYILTDNNTNGSINESGMFPVWEWLILPLPRSPYPTPTWSVVHCAIPSSPKMKCLALASIQVIYLYLKKKKEKC